MISEPTLSCVAGLGLEPVDEIDHVEETAAGAGANAASRNGNGQVGLAGHEAVDLDDVGALDLDRFDFRILCDEVLALGDLVAAALVLGSNRLAGLFIDELLAQAIAGGLIDLPECNALGG